MCAFCFQSHQRLKVTRGHRNILIDKLRAEDVQELIQRPVLCLQQYHEDQPLEFYCEDCKIMICHKCSVVSHNRHNMTDTQKAAQKQKSQMSEAVAKLKAEILLYENEIKKQTELKDKNITDIINEEKKMKDTVEESIRDLREHEKKMKQKFLDIYEAEQKQHEIRLENLELITTQLKSYVERGQGILKRNISAEILQTNHTILERCDELLNARKSDRYKSPYFSYLVKKKFDILDQILVTKTDSSMCLAEIDDCKIGKESNFVVTRDLERLQCYQADYEIKVDILTPEGDHLETEMKDCKDGKYLVTYTSQCVGQHSAEIQVNGQPLIGSPFFVQVHHRQYQFAFNLELEEMSVGDCLVICDIAVSDKTGTIAVADEHENRIQLFSSNGKFQTQVKLDGKPISVAFTDCGDLVTLLSENNNKLCLFSEEGQFIKHINDWHLSKPQHLSIASDGRLIITDKADNKIKALSPDGNDLLLSFTAPDCDEDPECAVYHQDNFCVSYPSANCIKVFDQTGVYLYDIGCEGFKDGQFDCPVGLVIDKYNQLIVCDVGHERLQLFTLSGKFLSKLEEEYFMVNNPWYAALNNNGNLFVVERPGNKILVFLWEVFDRKTNLLDKNFWSDWRYFIIQFIQPQP